MSDPVSEDPADRSVFTLDQQQWDQFTERLARPAQEVPGLRELMNLPSVFEDEES